jgi:hypothetical protein
VLRRLACTLAVTLLVGCAPTAPPAAIAPASQGTVWLFFVDELHIAFRKTGHLRNLVRALANGLAENRDLFAMRTTGPSSISLDLTGDRTTVDEAIPRVSGSALKLSEIVEHKARSADEVQYRFRISIGEAQRMLGEHEAWPVRRRVMLYLSDGYDIPNVRQRLTSFARAARRANVRVFVLNTQVLPGEVGGAPVDPAEQARYSDSTRTSLRAIAESTGGSALLDRATLADAVQHIRTRSGIPDPR